MNDRDGAEVTVIGGGAAGLMAAIFAAEAGARVELLETTRDGGRKILISGGGRCNVLPSELSADRYVTSSSPNSLRKILLSWPLDGQRRFFEDELGIPLALEEESGKLFPISNKARDVRDALVRRARSARVRLHFDSRVRDLRPASGGWSLRTDGGELRARSVVLATGGLSVPQTGSDGWGLRVLGGMGHTIHRTYAALTPLTSDPPRHAMLAGVSLHAHLSAPPPGGPFAASGGFLFTHRGYSGPAVLDISHVAVLARDPKDQEIHVRWGDREASHWAEALATGGPGRIHSVLRQHLPTRLADRLLEEAGIDQDRTLAHLRREDRQELIRVLTRYSLPWTGDEGYRKAEVTGGGVSLAQVHPRTLESRVAPGLFLCGELLDAFGPIGGYNFAWAWATGRAAGTGAAAYVRSHEHDMTAER